MKTTRILIADDHHLVAESLCLLLGAVEGFAIMGSVNNGWQALDFVEKNEVDIVLADLHMPLLSGIEMTAKLKYTAPNTRCILLTMSEEAEHIRQGLQVGIYGYVMKSAEKPELIEAIRTVAKGEKYFSERIVRKLAEIPETESPTGKMRIEDIGLLTKREIEILKLIAQDHSNAEIADQLSISATTVETHRRNLMKKLGVNSAIGLMRWGLKNGVLEGEKM
jgi:DNA-binding NarL/FixJ family response regulator